MGWNIRAEPAAVYLYRWARHSTQKCSSEVCSVAIRSDCGCAVQLPTPLRGLFVVAADCVGGFVEHDFQFLCLFIPLISSGAARKGRGSLCLPSDGWMTGVDRCGRQSAHLPSSHQSALYQMLNFRVCLIFWSVQVLQYCIPNTFTW